MFFLAELQSFDEVNNFPWKRNIESDFGNVAGFWNRLSVQMDNREVDCE